MIGAALIDFNSLSYWCHQQSKDFAQTVADIQRRWPNAKLMFALDHRDGNQLRKSIYPDYKAHRRPTPPHMVTYFQSCEKWLADSGLEWEYNLRFEADDIIASWANQANTKDLPAIIISNDRDLHAATTASTTFITATAIYSGEALSQRQLNRKIGISPTCLADIKALAGDKGDNIPSVPDIGFSTAIKLIRRFGSIEQLIDNLDILRTLKWPKRNQWAESLSTHREQIQIAKQLAKLYQPETQHHPC